MRMSSGPAFEIKPSNCNLYTFQNKAHESIFDPRRHSWRFIEIRNRFGIPIRMQQMYYLQLKQRFPSGQKFCQIAEIFQPII
jgi:hypothetical protein